MLNGRLDYIKSVLFWMSCSSNYGDYSEEEYQELIEEYDRLVKENLGVEVFYKKNFFWKLGSWMM